MERLGLSAEAPLSTAYSWHHLGTVLRSLKVYIHIFSWNDLEQQTSAHGRLLGGLRRPSVCEGSIRLRAESSKPQERWIKPAQKNPCRWETAAYYPGHCTAMGFFTGSGALDYTLRIWGNEELSFWNVTAEVSFWPQAEKGTRDTIKEK